MFDKLQNSWNLAKASARVLRQDTELLVFPLISGAALLLVTASFFLPMAFFGSSIAAIAEGTAGIFTYALVFLFYLCQYTVIVFFNTALVGAAMIRLDGGDPTVGDGLRIAFARLPTILGYAVIAATVGMILRSAKERSNGFGRFVISMVGFAWSVATFLVVPVLAANRVGPIEAIKRSASILRKTWGEQLAGNAGIGMIFGMLFLLLTVIAVPSVIFVAQTGQPVLIGLVVAAFVLGYVLLSLVNSALSGIYSAAVYRYATHGDIGAGFDRALVEQAFVPKRA